MCLLHLPTSFLCLFVLDLAPLLTSLSVPIVVRWPPLLVAPLLLLASFYSLVFLPLSAALYHSTLNGYGRGRSVNCYSWHIAGQHMVAIGIIVVSQWQN